MIAGVVPCAGASSRMGRTKALLEVDGVTFVERVVGALRAGGCDPVLVVVGGTDPSSDRIGALAEASGARLLTNPDPGEGPITSLRIALGTVPQAEGIVYLPVDHPMLAGETVSRLVEAARAADARLAVPLHDGERGHPAYFARTLFPELTDPELQGGARTVVHRHLADALLLPVEDAGVRIDVDTPEAYDRILGQPTGGSGD